MTDKPDLKIDTLDDLTSADVLRELFLNGLGMVDFFIACTIQAPGIEPILGIRGVKEIR